jgi:rRNA maturation endonuclease Nob1
MNMKKKKVTIASTITRALTVANSYVCVECEGIFTGRVGNCPICGNGTVAPLARWLNGQTKMIYR